jgi:hypothetical protein
LELTQNGLSRNGREWFGTDKKYDGIARHECDSLGEGNDKRFSDKEQR